MAKSVYVGVSGFSYPAWKGEFYPEGTKSEEFLTFYSSRLGSVEINSSFYAFPSPTSVKGWTERTEKGFRFSFKAPKQITHILKLGAGAAEGAERLFAVLQPMGPRRGPILFQLAPYTKQDLALLEKFLSDTSDIKGRVFEFRNGSWLEDSTYRLLEKHGAGFCISETEDMKPVFRTTGGMAYFRLRKDAYDAKAVDAWAEKVTATSRDSDECYVYLRHDETGKNAVLAQRLFKSLSA